MAEIRRKEIITSVYSFSELDTETQKAIVEAKKAAENAYAPYSHFFVGASLLLEDGSIVSGNNQENAAYPSGICAERTALFYYGSLNNNKNIKKLIVTARKESETEFIPVTPCGACRQVIAEYDFKQNKSFKILMQGENNTWIECDSIEDLLPFVFNPRSLE